MDAMTSLIGTVTNVAYTSQSTTKVTLNFSPASHSFGDPEAVEARKQVCRLPVDCRYFGLVLDDEWEGLDPDTLLLAFTPELRFRSDETYRPSKASLATDTYSTDEPVHSNHLEILGEAIASANPDDEELDLSLDFLSGQKEVEYADAEYINEPDFEVNEMAVDEIISAPVDYNMMLSEHPGVYDNFTYGRVIEDPEESGDRILQYWFYYYYNQFQYQGAGDHEGDWEWVQIRVDEFDNPISAAFGQHGNGEKCDWVNVETDGDTTMVVWPGVGSHANYFHPGDDYEVLA
jgi:hypothetical protein